MSFPFFSSMMGSQKKKDENNVEANGLGSKTNEEIENGATGHNGGVIIKKEVVQEDSDFEDNRDGSPSPHLSFLDEDEEERLETLSEPAGGARFESEELSDRAEIDSVGTEESDLSGTHESGEVAAENNGQQNEDENGASTQPAQAATDVQHTAAPKEQPDEQKSKEDRYTEKPVDDKTWVRFTKLDENTMVFKMPFLPDNFDRKTPVRSAELVMGMGSSARVFYVSLDALAESCDYFSRLRSEKPKEVSIEMEGEDPEGFLIFLRAVIPCPLVLPVDDLNLLTLTTHSLEYGAWHLFALCEQYLLEHISELEDDLLLDIFKAIYRKEGPSRSFLANRLFDWFEEKLPIGKFDELKKLDVNLALELYKKRALELAQKANNAQTELASLKGDQPGSSGSGAAGSASGVSGVLNSGPARKRAQPSDQAVGGKKVKPEVLRCCPRCAASVREQNPKHGLHLLTIRCEGCKQFICKKDCPRESTCKEGVCSPAASVAKTSALPTSALPASSATNSSARTRPTVSTPSNNPSVTQGRGPVQSIQRCSRPVVTPVRRGTTVRLVSRPNVAQTSRVQNTQSGFNVNQPAQSGSTGKPTDLMAALRQI